MDKKGDFKLAEELRNANVPKDKRDIILEHVREKVERERTLKLSIKEGSASSVMSGLGDSFITPYALTLNASNIQIGFLSSFLNLLSPIAGIFGNRLMEKYPRKKIIVNFVALQALMWLPIAFLSLFLWKDVFTNYLPAILIVFYTLYAILGSVAGPSWFSMMGDLVPDKIRGRYFAKRSKITSFVALVAFMIGAFALDYLKTKGLILAGFSAIFFISFIARLIAAGMFRKHHDPKFKLEKDSYFSPWQFLKKAPFNNFGKFVIFSGLINFGIMIASPFFSVYMLKELNFSYVTYMIVNASATVFTILFITIWGKFSDKYGNRELLKLGGILISIMPIAWIFSGNPIYLILVPQLISGVGWAAFNLASSNFIYDSVTPQKRGLCLTYYNITTGIGLFLGAILGGFLAQYITISFMNKFLLLFLLSGLLRLIFSIIMIYSIKEVKPVASIKSNPITYIKEIRPVKGVVHEIISDLSGLMSLRKAKRGKLNLEY